MIFLKIKHVFEKAITKLTKETIKNLHQYVTFLSHFSLFDEKPSQTLFPKNKATFGTGKTINEKTMVKMAAAAK